MDAYIRLAPSQLPRTKLHITLGTRLRYDFPGRRQRWEYWDVEDASETVVLAETWINRTLYELDYTTQPTNCTVIPLNLEVLRPDWLVHTTYVASHYLDRQPPKNVSGICYTPYSAMADLFQVCPYTCTHLHSLYSSLSTALDKAVCQSRDGEPNSHSQPETKTLLTLFRTRTRPPLVA